jgi:hypothetical protein
MPMPLSTTASVFGRLVRHDADFGRRAVGDQLGRGYRLIAQLVAGVRCVRNQLAQEDVGLRIDRVHHQVQKLGNLGLERLGFGGSGGCHQGARREQGKSKALI